MLGTSITSQITAGVDSCRQFRPVGNLPQLRLYAVAIIPGAVAGLRRLGDCARCSVSKLAPLVGQRDVVYQLLSPIHLLEV